MQDINNSISVSKEKFKSSHIIKISNDEITENILQEIDSTFPIQFPLSYNNRGKNKKYGKEELGWNKSYSFANGLFTPALLIQHIGAGYCISHPRIGDTRKHGGKLYYRRKKDTCGKVWVLMMDVDKENLYEFMDNHEDWFLVYTSYSHSEENHRFRVLYILDYPIPDTETLETIARWKCQICNGDEACVGGHSIFYGATNATFYLNTSYRTYDYRKLLSSALDYFEEHPEKKHIVKKHTPRKNPDYDPKYYKVFDIGKNTFSLSRLKKCGFWQKFTHDPTSITREQRIFLMSQFVRTTVNGKSFWETLKLHLEKRDRQKIWKYEDDYNRLTDAIFCNHPSEFSCPMHKECPMFQANMKSNNLRSLKAFMRKPGAKSALSTSQFIPSVEAKNTVSIEVLRNRLEEEVENAIMEAA